MLATTRGRMRRVSYVVPPASRADPTRRAQEAEANLAKNLAKAENDAKVEEYAKEIHHKKQRELEEMQEARKAKEAADALPDVKLDNLSL